MEDYYSILGIDPGTSQESIKLVYRRLAREYHPDRKTGSTESEKEGFSAQMAQLNGAYAVLSNVKLRCEYDQKLKIQNALPADDTASPVADVISKPKSDRRVAPQFDLDLTLACEFSKQLRMNFLAQHRSLPWKEKALEGFDWGLEASIWSSHYCVAGRGFGVLDFATAKKFTNYSLVTISRCNRTVRRSHFLFLLPFQRLYEWEFVSGEFNRFISTEGRAKFSNVPFQIVLLDARQGRTVRFGSPLREKRLEELLQIVSSTF